MSGCEEEAAAVSYGRSQILNELELEILESFCKECPNYEVEHDLDRTKCKAARILAWIDKKRGL